MVPLKGWVGDVGDREQNSPLLREPLPCSLAEPQQKPFPANDLVFFKLIFPRVFFSGGVFFSPALVGQSVLANPKRGVSERRAQIPESLLPSRPFHRVASRRVTSCHVTSLHVMSCNVMSCHVTSCHVMTCRPPHCATPHGTPPHTAAHRRTPPHTTARGTAPHGTAQHGTALSLMRSDRVWVGQPRSHFSGGPLF